MQNFLLWILYGLFIVKLHKNSEMWLIFKNAMYGDILSLGAVNIRYFIKLPYIYKTKTAHFVSKTHRPIGLKWCGSSVKPTNKPEA